MLPVGISFYTFQELSYTIERLPRHLQGAAQLPRLRGVRLFLPAARRRPDRAGGASAAASRAAAARWSWALAQDAALLIFWGYFKKLVIADNAGVIANKVFALQEPGFFVLWAGVFAFGIQIYARLLRLQRYRARRRRGGSASTSCGTSTIPTWRTGPVEFWRRWHISLSTWFRDYVYIPLGGSRGGRWKHVAQHLRDVSCLRPLARRQLELTCCGARTTARCVVIARLVRRPPTGVARVAARSRSRCSVAHVRARQRRLADVP